MNLNSLILIMLYILFKFCYISNSFIRINDHGKDNISKILKKKKKSFLSGRSSKLTGLFSSKPLLVPAKSMEYTEREAGSLPSAHQYHN